MPLSKRAFDFLSALAGLVLLSPLLALIAMAVKLDDGHAVFFRQTRLGRRGQSFVILKFRTMATSGASSPQITAAGDQRVTRIGKILRRTKLDELPQLWNVLCGSMSFVGPRPEVPAYLAYYPVDLRPVLDLTPGITDLASIYFRREEELLAPAKDREVFYRTVCLPAKLRMSLTYARLRSLADDLRILGRTVFPALAWPTRAERQSPEVYTQLVVDVSTPQPLSSISHAKEKLLS